MTVQINNQIFKKRTLQAGKASQSACSKTIEELCLKNKIPARGNIVLQRKLQDQEVQVESENHRRGKQCESDSSAIKPICMFVKIKYSICQDKLLNMRNRGQLHNL